MESSEEDDDFPSIESITSQSKIDSLYQSHTEKGIRKLCCELLDLKDAVENLCGNMRTKYLAFLRISEEAVEMKHELNELRKHISSQGILVQDLMTGVCSELEEWNKINEGEKEESEDLQNSELKELLLTEADDPKMAVLESLDDLLAEHKIDETVETLVAEEKNSQELKGSADNLSAEASAYRSAFMQRKAKVEDQLVEIAEHPSVSMSELKKALSALITLGKGPLAHHLFIKSYGSRLQKNIDVLLPSCTVCPRIFPATLAKLVFSGISRTIKESSLIFGDDPIYTNRVVQWAEWEIEFFARLVKENLPSPETVSALHAACVCAQASLTYCMLLEKQGLKLSKLLLVLLRPYIEEVLELNFRRARRAVLNLAENEEDLPMTPRFVSPLSAFATTSDNALIASGLKFMYIVDEILEQITTLAVSHFGASIFSRISQLFDKYVDALIKALPGPSDDDNIELKDVLPFRAETDSEQLALLGMAYTIAEELLPEAIWNLLSPQNESKELKNGTSENGSANSANPVELKEWKRRFHPSFEKLRDHFCRQYVLSFIYSGEGETRLDAKIYLGGNEEDQSPSRPLQALLAKLQQLSMVAEDVLHGKDKIQKNLLARLTETYLMWLSDEQEFWGVFEDESSAIQPKGLQKLILDMHFTVEIACYGGYPSRNVHQIASAIIARAIRAFSARGIDPQRTLPEDEWFVVTAKSAISNFLSGASESDTSEIGEEHIMHDDVIYDSEETTSSLSSIESVESFASASMGELESPMFTDPEN